MGRLENKVAIITGGASGIGEAIASAFVAEGARVCIADVSRERGDAVAARLGAAAMALVFDVREPAACAILVQGVIDRFGGIDVLVNSAGVVGVQAFLEVTPEEFDRVMDVNARGMLFTTQAVARAMIKLGRGGAVINIAALGGRRGIPGAATYCASKAAVISVTQSAAAELIAYGIRVNAIAPGAVQTPMWEDAKRMFAGSRSADVIDFEAVQLAATPAGRLATPEDLAGIVVFFAGVEGAHIIGQTVNVDGGAMMN